MRKDIMHDIKRVIEDRGLSQKAAGVILGVTRERVSDLVNGKDELFSIGMLVSFMEKLGYKVTLNYTIELRGGHDRTH